MNSEWMKRIIVIDIIVRAYIWKMNILVKADIWKSMIFPQRENIILLATIILDSTDNIWITDILLWFFCFFVLLQSIPCIIKAKHTMLILPTVL